MPDPAVKLFEWTAGATPGSAGVRSLVKGGVSCRDRAAASAAPRPATHGPPGSSIS